MRRLALVATERLAALTAALVPHAVHGHGGRCGDEPIGVDITEASSTIEGLNGLGGNVAEWVSDWAGPYGAEALRDPPGPPNGTHKIVRGGGLTEVSNNSK